MASTVQEPSAPATSRSEKKETSGVLLLPSHLFFVRTLELPPGVSAEEITSFVELSLEQMSPFALNQLYYGYYQPPGGSHVLVFAAYRKQLADIDASEEWIGAEIVLPAFASVLGSRGEEREKPLLVFLDNGIETTAIYWAAGGELPEKVVSRRHEIAEGGPSASQIREDLRKKLGGLPSTVVTNDLRNPRGRFHEKNLVFEFGPEEPGREKEKEREGAASIARPAFLTMDVRDKVFLLATRRARRQNRMIWGGVLVILAAFFILAVFEGVLFAGEKILATRAKQIEEIQPEVTRIMREEELAVRLEELNGQQLLPFEILSYLNRHRPAAIYYTRYVTDGLNSFQIEAETPKSDAIDRFKRVLENDEALERIEIRGLRLAANGRSSFTLLGSIRADRLRAFASGASREGNEPEAGSRASVDGSDSVSAGEAQAEEAPVDAAAADAGTEAEEPLVPGNGNERRVPRRGRGRAPAPDQPAAVPVLPGDAAPEGETDGGGETE